MGEPRPVITLHLPVPADLYIEVQNVFMRAYPKLRSASVSEVMQTRATSRGQDIAFLADEPGEPGDSAGGLSWEDQVVRFLAQVAGDEDAGDLDVDAVRLRAAELLLDRRG